MLSTVATTGTCGAGGPYIDSGRGRGPSGHSGHHYGGVVGAPEPDGGEGEAGRNTGCARGQPVPLACAGRRDPPDRGKSGGNKIRISSGSHDRSPTRWCAPNELGPGTSSGTGCRRTTVQGREGCKQGRPRALWACSLWCPRSPTGAPLCRPSSPSLLLFHSDQVSP